MRTPESHVFIHASSHYENMVFKIRTVRSSTMQKIDPVGCFNLCHGRFVYIDLFPVI